MEGTDPPRCEVHYAINAREKGSTVQRRFEGKSHTYNEVYMPAFYYRTLKPTLARKLEEALEQTSPMQQLATYEELALTRIAADQAVQLFSHVMEGGDPNQILATSMVMRDALKDVVSMARDTATLEDARQKLNGAFAQVLSDVLQSVVRAANEAFGDDYRVGVFEKLLREHLEMRAVPLDTNDDGRKGTLLTPDQDAIDMDSSVPAHPDPEPVT